VVRKQSCFANSRSKYHQYKIRRCYRCNSNPKFTNGSCSFPRRNHSVLSNNYRPQKRHRWGLVRTSAVRAIGLSLLTPSGSLHAPTPLASPISHEYSRGMKGRVACAESKGVRLPSASEEIVPQKSLDSLTTPGTHRRLNFRLNGSASSSIRDALACRWLAQMEKEKKKA